MIIYPCMCLFHTKEAVSFYKTSVYFNCATRENWLALVQGVLIINAGLFNYSPRQQLIQGKEERIPFTRRQIPEKHITSDDENDEVERDKVEEKEEGGERQEEEEGKQVTEDIWQVQEVEPSTLQLDLLSLALGMNKQVNLLFYL